MLSPVWAVIHVAIATALLVNWRKLFASGFGVTPDCPAAMQEVSYLYLSFSIIIILMIGASYLIPAHSTGIILNVATAFLAMAMLRLIWTIKSPCTAIPFAFCSSEVTTAFFIFWGLKSNAAI